MGCEPHYYSIKEVSEKTGVNSVTLRAWQRRYGLLNPKRTEKGHRLYSDQDIEKIHHILSWLARGVAIGKVRPLLDEAIYVENAPGSEPEELKNVESLITILNDCNSIKLEQRLIQLMKEYPLDVFIRQVVVPVENEIKRPQNPLNIIQKSLWQSVVMERCLALIAQAKKRSARRCYLLSFDKQDNYRLWLEAWRLTEKGYNVTVLAELGGRLAALETALQNQGVSKLVVFGENRLSPADQAQLGTLLSKIDCDYQLLGSISEIHPDLRAKA